MRDTLSELAAHFTIHEPKGEIVIVVAGIPGKEKNKEKDNPNKFSEF